MKEAGDCPCPPASFLLSIRCATSESFRCPFQILARHNRAIPKKVPAKADFLQFIVRHRINKFRMARYIMPRIPENRFFLSNWVGRIAE